MLLSDEKDDVEDDKSSPALRVSDEAAGTIFGRRGKEAASFLPK